MTPDLALQLLRQHFPDAETAHHAPDSMLVLLRREFGLRPDQLLLAAAAAPMNTR